MNSAAFAFDDLTTRFTAFVPQLDLRSHSAYEHRIQNGYCIETQHEMIFEFDLRRLGCDTDSSS